MTRILLRLGIATTCGCGGIKADAAMPVDASAQHLVVTPTTLTVPEGTVQTFNVLLGAEPAQSVTVNITSTDPVALPVSPGSITFTGGADGNWPIPVQVRVSPPIDTNDVSETATITIAAPGVADPITVAARSQDTTVIRQYGWPTSPQFTQSTFVVENTLFAYRIAIDKDTNLDRFGIFNSSTVRDSLYRMALYQDTNGRPGMLIAQMAVPVALGVGVNTFDIQPDVRIDTADTASGHTFWLLVESSQGIYAMSNANLVASRCGMLVTNITDPWPRFAAFDPTKCVTASPLNMWIDTFHQ